MFRNGLMGFLVAVALATPTWAGELDGERTGTPIPSHGTIQAVGDVLGTTAGQEMDREAPAQANHFYGPRYSTGAYFNVGFRGGYGYGGGFGYGNYGYRTGYYGGYSPAYYGGGYGYRTGYYGGGYGGYGYGYRAGYYGGGYGYGGYGRRCGW